MTEVSEVRRINVEPGDVFVLEVEDQVSAHVAQRIRDQWKQVAGDAPLMIVPGRLTCYRPVDSGGDADEPPSGAVRP